MANVDEIVEVLEGRDSQTVRRFLGVVYEELKQIARRTRKRPGDSMNTTALVHELVLRLRLLEGESIGKFRNRSYFFGAAARAMRQILVEHARKRRAKKRGGGGDREEFSVLLDRATEALEQGARADLLDLDEALAELQRRYPRQHAVATLRFFGGLTEGEVTECLGIGKTTVQEDWRFARAWLGRHLAGN